MRQNLQTGASWSGFVRLRRGGQYSADKIKESMVIQHIACIGVNKRHTGLFVEKTE